MEDFGERPFFTGAPTASLSLFRRERILRTGEARRAQVEDAVEEAERELEAAKKAAAKAATDEAKATAAKQPKAKAKPKAAPVKDLGRSPSAGPGSREEREASPVPCYCKAGQLRRRSTAILRTLESC